MTSHSSQYQAFKCPAFKSKDKLGSNFLTLLKAWLKHGNLSGSSPPGLSNWLEIFKCIDLAAIKHMDLRRVPQSFCA
ncbi:MAG: hypothetical protein N2235_21480 [Fischerella sp.]|nr:hypothetical protein [Fischerella sp.]